MIVAGAVCLAWCVLAVWLGPRIGYLDRPDDPALKAHLHPAVPLGGVGVFLGVHLAALARDGLDVTLLAATAIVLVLGLVDDRRGLPPVVRLGVELAAAAVLVFVGGPDGGPVFIVLSIALVVLAINAVNLFDGLDGLAASVTLVTVLGIAWLGGGRGLDTEMPLEMVAALGGFLVLGWHPARVFLGDAGAYVIGLLLAHAIIESSGDSTIRLMISSGLLGVLAVDLMVTMLRRRRSGHPLFLGDRSHIYDQLRDRGLSVPGVALAMAAAQAAIVVIVVVVDRSLGPWPSLLVLASIVIVVVALLARLGFLRPEPR
ncbi:MAG TPA: MraY family glycosyltransferase [Acidimicrobiia bacterium]|nr:MraY family glycosyltransferase [Acidimicrobiia bacterium]